MAHPPAVLPYRWLAQYYDRFFTFHEGWLDAARRRLLAPVLPGVESACDLACGTGTTAVALAQRGIRMCAVDLSAAMCRLARRKANEAGVAVRVIRADMRDFRLPAPVDLVLCEYDALNHVPRPSGLARVARSVYRALRPGGCFLFDVNTRRALETVWPGTWMFEKDGVVMVMEGDYDARRRKGVIDVDWFVKEGALWRRHRERVEQVAWPEGEMRDTLRRAGFIEVRSWDAAKLLPRARQLKAGCRTFWLARR